MTGPSGWGARAVLVVVFIVTLTMSLSNNMLSIALPALSAHFRSSSAMTTAMVVAYNLANTALLIPGGQIADWLDRRKVFLGGLLMFGALSLLMGFSPNAGAVAVGRGLQGVAGALLLSNAVAILAAVFPRGRLAGAMGVYLAGFSLGQVGGPILGGILVDTLGWRWLFWGTVPPAVVALAAGLWALRNVPVAPARTVHLDWAGGLILALFLAASQLLLALSADVGLLDPVVVIGFAGCVALLPVLVLVERRLRHPVLAPEIFRVDSFRWGLVQGGLVMLPRFGAMTIAGLYFQGVAGDSAPGAAFKVVPFAAGLTVGSLAAGVMSRFHERAALIGSAAVATTAMLGLLGNVRFGLDWVTMLALAVLGLGNGVFQGVNSAQTMSQTPLERTGVVNAVRVMVLSFGSGVGLALAVSLVVAFTPHDIAAHFLSGRAEAVAPFVALIDRGYQVAYGVFAVLMGAGLLVCVLTPTAPGTRPAS